MYNMDTRKEDRSEITSFFKKYVHQIILSFFFFRSNQVVAATTSNNKLSKTHGYSFSFLQFQERISLSHSPYHSLFLGKSSHSPNNW